MIAFSLEISARYPDGLMFRPATPRELFRQRNFILRRALIFFEAECDCSQVAPLLRRQRCDGGRIQPGREENAHRDISHKMITYGLLQSQAQEIFVAASL